jgi:K+-sensing histidine kinase KdpD
VLVVAVTLPLVACAVLSGFREAVSQATSALILVLIVVGLAATGDRIAGLVAALSGGAWFDFFLTEPYNSFAIRSPDDVEVAILLVLAGTGVSELALWGRRQAQRASMRAGYLDGVLKTAKAISLHHEPALVLAEHVARQIADVLDVPLCRFVTGPAYDARFALLDQDGSVTRNGHRIDVDGDGLPTDEHTVLLVRRANDVLGHFLVTAAARIARPSLEQRRVAVLLADQMAVALLPH